MNMPQHYIEMILIKIAINLKKNTRIKIANRIADLPYTRFTSRLVDKLIDF